MVVDATRQGLDTRSVGGEMMYGRFIDWLRDDRNAWGVTGAAIVVIVLVYFL